jgi:multidrug efflux system membrane fusion protein
VDPGGGVAGVAVDSMKARRLGLYVAGATVGVGAAYLLGFLPQIGPASPETPKAVANKAKGRAPAAPVTAATVIASDMPVILVAPGIVEPFANVAVKTRVDGQIVEVLFKEGDLVKERDVLFRLDDRLVKAQIAQVEANIAKDQASLRDAEATLTRREALIGKKIVT